MMRDDAWKAYESWRRLWLSGGDSNAIAALRFHGLRGALAMAGAACNRTQAFHRIFPQVRGQSRSYWLAYTERPASAA